mmetsp:Transcript_36908/g.37213  ORF Transcript_36908/g.37213 Transcript_36908/m.37213 type:complete len:244 (-) Transcript_36908:767-1498(-)
MGLFSRLREKLESLDDEKVVIKADVRMISGCMDAQTSADVSNVDDFQLPDPAGKPGGACTSALLKVLYDEEKTPTDDLTFSEVLEQMRTVLDEEYEQIPQLSSSHALDVSTPFTVVGGEGTKRALLIGINYIGQNGELSGCHNDALRIKKYLMDVYGYEEENFTYLMDNGVYDDPTYDNILAAFDDIVAKSEAGDSVFVHYSGKKNDNRYHYNDRLQQKQIVYLPRYIVEFMSLLTKATTIYL